MVENSTIDDQTLTASTLGKGYVQHHDPSSGSVPTHADDRSIDVKPDGGGTSSQQAQRQMQSCTEDSFHLLYLFAGAKRQGYLQDIAAKMGIHVAAFDLERSLDHDLLDDMLFASIIKHIAQGR